MLKTQETRQADVLEVISNLSSDEVFTPPKVVNEMLDLLPEEVWSDPSLRWLDPGTKTGVFLREITRRLMVGLEEEFPDENERLQHILKEMVFGIAITELTALMARRTLYCSKDASSERSIVEMPTSEGNIWFERTEHDFNDKGRCSECGASKDQIERGEDLENYAYGFIHMDGRKKIEEVMEMKFDVIVGNPPYQMGSDGGTRTMPVYDKFVEQAKELQPRYITLITPSRWMASGLGLAGFRESMLGDRRISRLVDFPDANDVFSSGVEIKGGVSYFLWDREAEGPCEMTLVRSQSEQESSTRELGEFDVLVRDGRAVKILRKVLAEAGESITEILSADKEFGMTSNYSDYGKGMKRGAIDFYAVSAGKRVDGWIERRKITKSVQLIDSWKVLIPQAGSDGGKEPPDIVLGRPRVVGPPSVCTQTYLFFFIGSETQAQSIEAYIRTRFFRFLVSLRKITQHATRSTYLWVPQQPWDREWTDEELYEKYGITKKEQAYIEEMIKEMSSE